MTRPTAITVSVLSSWFLSIPVLFGGCARSIEDETQQVSETTLVANERETGAMDDIPLIPRNVLFGNPQRAGARLSPDGKWLSFQAPVDGVMNVWVAPVDDLSKAFAVTKEKVRP